MCSKKIWQALDKLNNGCTKAYWTEPNRTEHSLSRTNTAILKFIILDVQWTKKNYYTSSKRERESEKFDAASVLHAQLLAHLMHSTGKIVGFLEEIVEKVWKTGERKKMESIVVEFVHGNSYEIKIIKFGERNLCKRCYLVWNIYVITSSVQYTLRLLLMGERVLAWMGMYIKRHERVCMCASYLNHSLNGTLKWCYAMAKNITHKHTHGREKVEIIAIMFCVICYRAMLRIKYHITNVRQATFIVFGLITTTICDLAAHRVALFDMFRCHTALFGFCFLVFGKIVVTFFCSSFYRCTTVVFIIIIVIVVVIVIFLFLFIIVCAVSFLRVCFG